MTKKVKIQMGGDLDKALKGDYDFDLKAVLKEGWALTQNTKGVMFSGLLLSFLIAYILLRLFVFTDGQIDLQDIQNNPNPYVGIAITVLIAPILAGVQMMGINHSVGGRSQLGHLFHFVPLTLILATTDLVTSLLAELGLTLAILPGIYLMIAFTFAIPLVAERRLSPFIAMYYSLRVVTSKLWKFTLLYGLFFVLLILCFLTLGLATIWIGPFYYNVKGILYRDIFGMGITIEKHSDKDTNEESIFNA
ncbi:hypothetical protein QX776_03585 [Alteromonadaceae bacterium BrNp21-10]|nr:hypothetical protein [Alteromonadaceae bacterium BrNp21-10]